MESLSAMSIHKALILANINGELIALSVAFFEKKYPYSYAIVHILNILLLLRA